jgi:hypothetical protein
MSFLNSYWFQLLGRRPVFVCRSCGKRGGMFMKSGVQNIGQFEVISKQESGHLLLECSSCTRRFEYDPIKVTRTGVRVARLAIRSIT